MQRSINGALLLTTLLFLAGCGSGGSDPDIGAVSISVQINEGNSVIQVEMIKDLASASATFQVTASSTFENPSTPVVNVTVDRYVMTFTREDGGPTIGPYTRDVGIRLNALNNGFPSEDEFQAIILSTEDKLFSDFGIEFANTLNPAVFQVTLQVFASNDAGDDFTSSVTFQIEAAAYEPYNDLVPVVDSFLQTEELVLGEAYRAQWRTSGRIDQGLVTLPWGDQFVLGSEFFPFGSVEASTLAVQGEILPGTTKTYNSGVLFVRNPFGSDEGVANDVEISRPAEEPPTAISIDEFFGNPTTVELGNTVDLTWSISGGPTGLSLLPDTYSGQTVSFADKNLAFDSVTITPEESVRPILQATNADGSTDTEFLATPITVTIPVDPEPDPIEIVFFTTDRSIYQLLRQPVFFWETRGPVQKAEIFPINGNRIDVTGQNQLLSSPLLEVGNFTFSLLVTGQDGSFLKQDVTIEVTEVNNIPVEILDVTQAPGSSIDNGDQGSFSFTVSDSERKDSSYTIEKIAGDSASFFPKEGEIRNGLGQVSVAFTDFDDNNNGFLTFEISAYDDPIFGATRGSTRAVELVTFTTSGVLPDTAPVISDVTFVDGSAEFPGSRGVITFSILDPDTPDLRWQIGIVSGDLGGSLSPTTDVTNTFGGDFSVTYEDDPDTPNEPVVFLIRVDEISGANRQYSLATLRVQKGTTDDGPGGTPSTTDPIAFPFNGLYSNASGTVDSNDAISNEVIYFTGDGSNPRFYRFSDLSGEITSISYVFDISHNSTDPAAIVDVDYARNFLPAGSEANNGSLNFVGYFTTPSESAAPSATPIANGVSRWRMTFNVEDFNISTGNYNLPSTGNMNYTLTITVNDVEGNQETLTKSLTVVVP
ncbi:MAG: hypothetical protein QNK37_00235 [Acidobacteriota bacterium]|nr:hypothetical protein [Acidobacteriota bacterium]